MTFYDPTLYGRDDEEEFGDSGAYSESLEEDFEEEEEEEEEAGIAEPAMSDAGHARSPATSRAQTRRSRRRRWWRQETCRQEESAGQEKVQEEGG